MDSPSKVSPSPSQSEIMDVEEILNCNFEYEPLDLPTAVPLFYQTVTNNDSTISIDDLNVFQAQLEILATDAAKRKCILRNKIKAIPPEQLEESEELLKQLKITNYEKYQQQLQSEQGFDAASGTDNNGQTQTPKVDMIDNMLKSQITTLYEDAMPTRFWNFVQSFDLNESHLKMLEDYLSGNVPFRQIGNKKYGKQSSKTEFKDLFDVALKNQIGNHANNGGRFKKRTKIGPYTRRLMKSLILTDSEKGCKQKKELKAILTKHLPKSQVQANIIEKSVLNVLQSRGLVETASQQENHKKDNEKADTLTQLERRLDRLSNNNEKTMKMLACNVKYELLKKRMQQPMKNLQVDLIKTFKNIVVEKQKSETIKPEDEIAFELALDRKKRLLSFMRNMCL